MGMSALLELDGVSKSYPLGGGRMNEPPHLLRAVADVTLSVARGETLALVGESGCGKSSLARLVMRLEAPSAGRVRFDGTDLATLAPPALKAMRRRFQMIFQDPYASLNPRMSVRAIIAEALRNFRTGGADAIAARVSALAQQAGLSAYHLDRYPHELSGGQCQRVGIARAIALAPDLIVADEPVSALDVSIQAQILNLIVRLQAEMNMALLFVSHDLSAVAHIADRVAVMYLGRIVELAPKTALFAAPRHPYTQLLLASAPQPVPAARQRPAPPAGELPSPLDPPSGCAFRTRCPHADARCAAELPALRPIAGGAVACHHAERLSTPTSLTQSQVRHVRH
jgi:oligopeptide/dipeptide ABC transporter ATP-binding protein